MPAQNSNNLDYFSNNINIYPIIINTNIVPSDFDYFVNGIQPFIEIVPQNPIQNNPIVNTIKRRIFIIS